MFEDDPGDAALRSNENRLSALVDSIEDYAIYMLDPLGHVVTWNRGATRSTGYSAAEVLGRHFRIFFVSEDIEANIPAEELEAAASSGRCAGEGWRLRKNGERFWASFAVTAIHDDSGRLNGFAKVIRDLSDKKRQHDAMLSVEMRLREERDSLLAAAECSMDALYICEACVDERGNIEDFVFTYLNGNVEKLTSLPRGVMLGRRISDLFPAYRDNGLLDRYKQVVITGEPMAVEMQAHPDKVKAPWMRIQAVKHHCGVAITISDITERKLSEQRIFHVAHHDHLTGLPNRRLLQDRIGQAMERARRFGGKVAVFMVDLDSFKHINDTFGHATGDGVLVTVAVRLKAAVRATDSVIRIGGDEFVVVMSDISDSQHILTCAEKILDALQNNMDVAPHTVRTTCSVGFAVYPGAAQTGDELLALADAAMYSAKRNGKNQYAASGPAFNATLDAPGDVTGHAPLLRRLDDHLLLRG